jgi:hypothetical protein
MQLIIFLFYMHKLMNYIALPDDLPDNLLYMFLLSRPKIMGQCMRQPRGCLVFRRRPCKHPRVQGLVVWLPARTSEPGSPRANPSRGQAP